MGLTIGLLWCLCSVLCIVKRDKSNKRTERNSIIFGIGFGFFGICGLLGTLLSNKVLNVTCVLLSVGILCIFAFGVAVYRLSNCNTQIWGTYVSSQKYAGHRGFHHYAPIFRYNFGGVEYERQTNETYSLKKLNRKFSYGQMYPIWINENAPESFITKKRIQAGHVMTLLAGILVLVSYFAVVINSILG